MIVISEYWKDHPQEMATAILKIIALHNDFKDFLRGVSCEFGFQPGELFDLRQTLNQGHTILAQTIGKSPRIDFMFAKKKDHGGDHFFILFTYLDGEIDVSLDMSEYVDRKDPHKLVFNRLRKLFYAGPDVNAAVKYLKGRKNR